MVKHCPTVVVFKDHSHMSEVFSPNTADDSVTGPDPEVDEEREEVSFLTLADPSPARDTHPDRAGRESPRSPACRASRPPAVAF